MWRIGIVSVELSFSSGVIGACHSFSALACSGAIDAGFARDAFSFGARKREEEGKPSWGLALRGLSSDPDMSPGFFFFLLLSESTRTNKRIRITQSQEKKKRRRRGEYTNICTLGVTDMGIPKTGDGGKEGTKN